MGGGKKAKRDHKVGSGGKKVTPFCRSAPYYSQKGTYYNGKNQLSKAMLFLKKAIEVEPEEPLTHYNLACLLSKIGHLEEANRIFLHIVRNMDETLTECYFFMAVNYGLMEDIFEAKRFLLKYLRLSPEGEMAAEAEDLLLSMEEEAPAEPETCILSINENDEMISFVELVGKSPNRERLIAEEEYHRYLQRGLYQGSDMLKEAIIQLLGDVDGEAPRQILAEFVANPWVNERLRQVALLQLKKVTPSGRYTIFNEGAFQEINLQHYPEPAPVWQTKWQQVLECAVANMRRRNYYSEEFFEDVEAIWIDFINLCYPEGPRIDKPQTWAAGLEYCLVRFHFLGLTQKELADAYGVSAASVQRKFSFINKLLHIDQKAYRNVFAYLIKPELESP